ncbi:MAG: hypothetical protein IPL01_16970 [Acidobacteria bacterium]|nr:hypothetical protein [Acidobacteriota bacterium]
MKKLSIKKTLNKIAALTLIFVMVAGTTFTASASDETRREGAKKSENKETGQPGQSAQAGQTGTSTIENQEKVAITVYNSNIGLVKDTARFACRAAPHN